MLTTLVETLVTKIWSNDHIYSIISVVNFISNTVISKRLGVVSLVDIIKIALLLIKPTYKESIKDKRIRKKCIKMQFFYEFMVKKD